MLAILMNNLRMQRRQKAKNERKKGETNCCRTCLTTEDLHPIFRGKSSEVQRSEELQLVTGLEVRKNDGLPQKICTKCLNSMKDALKFRQEAEKAHSVLTSMGYSKIKKSTTKVKVKPQVEITVERIDNHNDDYDDFPDDFAPLNDIAAADDQNQNDQYFGDNDIVPNDVEKKPTKKAKAKKEPTSYKCETCSKEFKMKSTYKAHIRFHTNYCVCELCGKKCRNNNLLLLHKRGKHGAERIHKCSYCEYSAANKEALVIHERRHTGEKPYICDHCGASFHRRSNLVQHIAIHLPDKNFQCALCPKRMKSRKFLQIHMHSTHTGRKYAYVCPVCARRFEKPNKVRKHMRSAHGAGEPFPPVPRVECELCFKKFQSKKFLRSHKFKQHQEKRYTYLCHICRNHFRTTDSVRKHLLRAHGVPREAQGPVYRIPNVNTKVKCLS